jgi:hypothetical protein
MSLPVRGFALCFELPARPINAESLTRLRRKQPRSSGPIRPARARLDGLLAAIDVPDDLDPAPELTSAALPLCLRDLATRPPEGPFQ